MAAQKVAISIDRKLLEELDGLVTENVFSRRNSPECGVAGWPASAGSSTPRKSRPWPRKAYRRRSPSGQGIERRDLLGGFEPDPRT